MSWKGKLKALYGDALASGTPTELWSDYLPDDQHAAQRILTDLGAHELERKLNIGSLLILNPLMQIARGEDDIVEQPAALGDLGLKAWLVQVLGTSLDDLLLMILNAAKNKLSINHLLINPCVLPSAEKEKPTPSRACGAG